MATEKKLDCVILGLLSHEDLTGYEIKKRMDTTLKYFWGASFGSIYPTLNGLVERGLATKRDGAENKRNKLIYTITDEGRNYLKEWLRVPAERDELRYETLLKLFFGKEEGPRQAIAHIDAFREKIEQEMPYLLRSEESLRNCLDVDEAHKYYLLTVEFGLKTYRAYLEWCKEAKAMLSENYDGGKEGERMQDDEADGETYII